jgi:hypothetical protein
MNLIGLTSDRVVARMRRDERDNSIPSLGRSIMIGSLLVITLAFGVIKTFFAQAAALFIANSAGYFLGALLYYSIRGKTGMLLWGVLYGLCLGSGLGLSIFLAQTPLREHLNNLKPRGNSAQL